MKQAMGWALLFFLKVRLLDLGEGLAHCKWANPLQGCSPGRRVACSPCLLTSLLPQNLDVK